MLTIDQQMQYLTADPGNSEVLKELERELHTLKGSSRMAQLTDMGNAAHEAEELLEGVRRERGRILSQEELSKLQSDIDQIGVLSEKYALSGLPDAKTAEKAASPVSESVEPAVGNIENIGDREEEAGVEQLQPQVTQERTYESYLERTLFEQSGALPDLSVLEGIDALSAEQAAKESAAVAPSLALKDQEQVRISAAYLDKMVESSNAMNIMQNATHERLVLMGEDVGEFGRTAARLKQLLRSLELETETQIHAGYRDVGEKNRQNTGFDPLEMDEYSEIQRLSRALAESLNDLVNIEGDLTTHLRTVDKFVSDSTQTGRELHQNLLTTRLVEVSAIIPRLRRIMRQVASEFGRKVSFEIDGETLKLDRYLLQRMTAPIEHLLRNAVFHGIETPDERVALGKVAEGGILLEVEREDTDVVFRISDDGRGLDKERICAKAIEQGLMVVGDQLSDQDVYKLILRSGFTTVTEANQVAGRGVGMDVVNSEIKALGGSLSIDSDSGSGSEFTVRLPLTMAANPVLFVAVQKQQYALPLGGVQGLTRLTAEGVKHHLGRSDAPLILDDQPYILQYLGDALGHPGRAELREGDMHVVIYMNMGVHHVAWLVDAINGRHEVVLQSLGALFKTCRFYSAATVTSDGAVIMVPDMLELTEQAMIKPPSEELLLADDEFVAPVVHHENPHILIVDDSITVRKVTEKLLMNENFVVETAKDGLEAMEKLAVFEADLVLLDIEMPRMDGFEVLSAVRNKQKWQDLPVIMISSRTAEKHLLHAKELGASDFLGKPYQNQDLLEHIFRHLRGDQTIAPRKSPMNKESVS
ncbi:MAG: Signal transduction histidine kinase CheA (EC [uncultured Thiotrichaceae bacterium]|uniref:Chemotaxis protein CheA n=1 Tax=uncultured Thiotrichaceae bacterium TaxID=298394 RepID=A0A6S6S3P4_9GAMM|nr:MAG: Signal transduction histidine kinase CheA (EC [uncultured Thiotrichaceae bacterium]